MASIVDLEEQRRDRSDTLIIGNYVGMKYTIPKKPKGESLKKHLEVIGSLSPGDTVLVSGGVTMLNSDYEVDFSEALKGAVFLNDAFDFLVTSIKKK